MFVCVWVCVCVCVFLVFEEMDGGDIFYNVHERACNLSYVLRALGRHLQYMHLQVNKLCDLLKA